MESNERWEHEAHKKREKKEMSREEKRSENIHFSINQDMEGTAAI